MIEQKTMQDFAREIKTAREVTEYVLFISKIARNDDEYLIKAVKSYCKENGLKIPKSETITRVRRKIQNDEGLYQPTADIQQRRKFREVLFSGELKHGQLQNTKA
jgi:hypothetical protein